MSFLRRILYFFWYLRRPPWDTGISPPELLQFLDKRPPGRAIDLGCGTGTNVVTMALRGWKVTGVDFIPSAVAAARQKAKESRVKVDLRVEDVTQLKGIEGPFDLALDMGCFHSLPAQGQQKYLDNLERILDCRGSFLLYVFFRQEAGQNGVTEEELAEIGKRLELVWREDGTERGIKPSAWLEYRKNG
jgi:cyclopropane fatty-acyl-phospholipid synthase-like methyltransferase